MILFHLFSLFLLSAFAQSSNGSLGLSLSQSVAVSAKTTKAPRPALTETSKARYIQYFSIDPNELSTSQEYKENKVKAPPPQWLLDFGHGLNELLYTFFKDISPNPNGTDTFNIDENIPSEFVKQLGKSNFSLVMPGGGTVRVLGGPLYYADYQGGVAVQYNFIQEGTESDPDQTVVGVRLFPAYGEIAFVHVSAAYNQPVNEPNLITAIGSAFGIELSRRVNWVEAGGKLVVRPLTSVFNEKDSGVSIMSILYMKFKLADLYKITKTEKDKKGRQSSKQEKAGVFLQPYIAYFNRGNQLEEHYNWTGWQNFSARSVSGMQDYWESELVLQIKFY